MGKNVAQGVARVNLTQAVVAKLTPPATGRTYYRDTKTRGLLMVVSASGAKTWQLYRRMGGRPTRLTLGRFADVTAEQAHKRAAQLGGELANGENPAARRRQVREESTLGELLGLWLEGYAKVHNRTWAQDEGAFNRYVPDWRNRVLSQIRMADVAARHAKIGRNNGHYVANRLVALLSTLFNYAAKCGYEGPNPCKGITRFPEISRDRFLDADELRRFFAALKAETDETWRDFFLLCLLTGARRGNVANMQWSDLEMARGLWRIPHSQSKNKAPLVVILCPAALEILKRRADQNAALKSDEQSPYVFPSRGESGHVFDPTKPWKRICERAALQNVRIHDLRRTLGSWQSALGASLQVIGKSLGHRDATTTAIYARLNLDPVRASVNAATQAIMAAADGEPATEPKALPAE